MCSKLIVLRSKPLTWNVYFSFYREGRTETVRSCSIASTEFVKAAVDPEISVSARCILDPFLRNWKTNFLSQFNNLSMCVSAKIKNRCYLQGFPTWKVHEGTSVMWDQIHHSNYIEVLGRVKLKFRVECNSANIENVKSRLHGKKLTRVNHFAEYPCQLFHIIVIFNQID